MQWTEFQALCDEFESIFFQPFTDIMHIKLLTKRIKTGDHSPVAGKPYPLALKHYEWIQEETNAIQKEVSIGKSLRSKNSPILVIK